MPDMTNSNSGSFTVEASIIFTTLIIILISMIFGFILLAQKVILVRTAAIAAQQGAEVWADSRRDIENGFFDLKEEADPLYHRLLQDSLLSSRNFEETIDINNYKVLLDETLRESSKGDLQDKKLAKIRYIIYKKLGSGILKPERTRIDIRYSNNLLKGKLEITLVQDIKIPLGNIKKFFDGKDCIELEAAAVAAVAEPAEYIRNIDLIVEYAKVIQDRIDLDSLLDKLKSVNKQDR